MSLNKKIVFFSCCLVGCIYQLATVSYDFFQFKVRAEITFEYPKEIEIPDIDMQIPITSLLNMSAIYMKYTKEMVEICKDLVGLSVDGKINSIDQFNKYCSSLSQLAYLSPIRILPLLTIGDVQQLTLDPRDMILNVYSEKLGLDLLKNGLCTINRYNNYLSIHLRISCRHNSNPFVMKLTENGLGDFYLLRIIIEKLPSFRFRLAKANSSFSDHPYNYNIVGSEPKKMKLVINQFRRLLSYSLPWPYETSCRHYDKSAFLLECINQLSMNSSNKAIYKLTAIPFDQHESKLKFGGPRQFERFFNECSKLIKQPECESTIFYSHTDEYVEDTLNPEFHGKLYLLLASPSDMDMISRVLPTSTYIEYLIYISSTLGLWFGISVYGQLTDHSSEIYKALKKLVPCSSTLMNRKKCKTIKIEAKQLTW